MNPLRNLASAIFIVLLTINAKSENPCGTMFPVNDTTNWGVGFIRADINETFGGIEAKTSHHCTIGKSEIIFNNDNKLKIDPHDFVYLGYYSTFLYKVFEVRDTKYKICINSIEGGIWVEFDDLAQIGLAFDTYVSFIGQYKNVAAFSNYEKVGRHLYMGINLLSSCLYLRSEPSKEGKIITCLTNNLRQESNPGNTHIEIQNVNDGWAHIIARIYIFDGNDNDNPDGCPSTVIKEYSGFVKIIGKNGIPNIWYATTSY